MHPAALIVASLTEHHSHWNASQTLSEYLAKHDVPGLCGIDTRQLTKKLRVDGSMKGKIVIEGDDADAIPFYDPNVENLVANVSSKQPREFNPNGDVSIVAVDVGLKYNQLRCLINRGAKVKMVPWDHDFSTEDADGIFLSNGPGDPQMADKTIANLKKLFATKPGMPIFGICLGHQLMSLACGAQTYKLPFGNRGHNQPAIHEGTGKCFITSQNHGFATDVKNLPDGWHPLFTNANDQSNEGIVHDTNPWFSVQFHPEANAGPRDLECLFEVFIATARGQNKGTKMPAAISSMLYKNERPCLAPGQKLPKPRKVLVLGSGGLSIGQAGEFDYSGSQAIKALKEEGIFTVLINPNIATVQTMKGLADKVYFLPVTPEFVEETIATERPDSILLSFGGQTALNCGIELEKGGVFKKYDVKVLGTPVQAIEDTEDREIFASKVASVGETTCPAHTCFNVAEVMSAASMVGFPVMIRSSFALGGLGSGVVKGEDELERMAKIAFSNTTQVTVERSCRGWKELEYEVVRDAYDNTITVCNMENFDPLGIHTGESIVIAPSQTLSNDEYNMLRDCAVKVVRMIGIVGECNIQYALNPDSKEYFIIEVNARLSRSSALASKATGYPLAYIAAKLALGYSLPELRNSVTKKTTACFEPSLDYCVVKVPRWDLNKFPTVDRKLGTAMKSVGEVMAIGRTFEETFQKALRMLDIGVDGFEAGTHEVTDDDLENPSDTRMLKLATALEEGYTVDRLYSLTKIDRWFLYKLEAMVSHGKRMTDFSGTTLPVEDLIKAKKLGFSDKQIGRQISATELVVRKLRAKHGIRPVVKQIDTVAAEYPAATNYLYLSYSGTENDIEFGSEFAMVLGSGVYRIGSSVEFDYCAVGCVRELSKVGYSTIMINCNPETVSTDYDECDRLYFEELTFETVMDIYEMETVVGMVLAMGGQIPNNMAIDLDRQNVRIFGTSPEMIDGAENRFKFSRMCDGAGIDQPKWKELVSIDEANAFCEQVTYPCLMRPSYILSGVGMRVVHSKQDLARDFRDCGVVNREYPVVISKFITGAKEIEVDAVAMKGKIIAYAISEHVENAGVHSGDATIIHPPQDLTQKTMDGVLKIAGQVAYNLKINGPFNIQFIAKDDELKVIECNVRVSRSFPFVSKTMGMDLISIATRVMVGLDPRVPERKDPGHVGVKVPQFSFSRLAGADPTLGVDMISTGEVACFGHTREEAYLKAVQATTFRLPKAGGKVLLSIGSYEGKSEFLQTVKTLASLGFELCGSLGTADFYMSHGVQIAALEWLEDASEESIQERMVEGEFDLVINLPMRSKYRRPASGSTPGALARRGAVDHKVSLITDIKCAKLFVNALSQIGLDAAVDSIDCQNSFEKLTFHGLVASRLPASVDGENAVADVTQAALSGGFTVANLVISASKLLLAPFMETARAQSLCDFSVTLQANAQDDGSQTPTVVRSAASPDSPTRPIRVSLSGDGARRRSQSRSTEEDPEAVASPVAHEVAFSVNPADLYNFQALIEEWTLPGPVCVEASGHCLSSAILFAHMYDCKMHIVGVQAPNDLRLIDAAKSSGIDVTCSVDLAHLFPPEDAADNANRLWSQIDQIDVLSFGNDSAFEPSMVLPLLISASKKRRVSLKALVAKISTTPSEIFGISQDETSYCEVLLSDNADTFNGHALAGRVTKTIVRGEVAFLDGHLFAEGGVGKHAKRSRARKVTEPTLVDDTSRASVTASATATLKPLPHRPDSPVGQFARSPSRTSTPIPMGASAVARQLQATHVLTVTEFDREFLHVLFNSAHHLRFMPIAAQRTLLAGHVLANIFYEPSTRTNCSFQSAMQRLGGSVISLDKMETTSLKKGESFADFIRTMECYADAIVIRHPAVGSVAEAAKVSKKPIINAGDGSGEHPTQAFLDIFTIREELGTVNGLNINVMGDLKHSRTVHSLVKLLSQYRVAIRLISPVGLEMPEEVIRYATDCGVAVTVHNELTDVLADADVLYVTRIQRERFESDAAYQAIKGSYVINAGTMSQAKEKMIVMHPLPRVDEIDPEVDSDPRAAYFRQMEYGVCVRMALLGIVLGKF